MIMSSVEVRAFRELVGESVLAQIRLTIRCGDFDVMSPILAAKISTIAAFAVDLLAL